MIPIIPILVMLIIVGFLLWLVGFLPLDGTIKTIIKGVIIFIVIIWLLQAFGLLNGLNLRLR